MSDCFLEYSPGEVNVSENVGKVTIAPNVLVTIVHKTAATVPGVVRLCENLPGAKRLLGFKTVGHGVEVGLVDDQVAVNVYLIARSDVDLLQMGRQLQQAITRAIQEIVGKKVHHVDIHIEDVESPPVEAAAGAAGPALSPPR